MLPFTPTQISAVAFAFALAAHAQVCPQCPDTDNIGRPVAGNTPLVPGAGICCMSVHALRRLRWMLITVISYLMEVVSVHRTLSKTIVRALSLDSDSSYLKWLRWDIQFKFPTFYSGCTDTAGGRQDVTDNKLLRAESGRQLAPLQVRKGVKNLVFLLQNYSHKKKIAQYEG
ncbi:hypothetical protein B0H13DRAFT_1912011 [Mycena leptocephala]|nr:hypothetical protein B0H13DRAFT_1912011 [Mycena leptocephala]